MDNNHQKHVAPASASGAPHVETPPSKDHLLALADAHAQIADEADPGDAQSDGTSELASEGWTMPTPTGKTID